MTGQTSNSITWEWNAVEGATGYQSQFSGTSTFPTGSTGREFSTNTTRTVSNLDAESDGYLRVRAYTGTQAEPVFGMWTEGEMGTTAEPPPAAPLSAPEGLERDARSDTSITLTWDSVRNAGSYEVEQREPGDDWGDANCGADGNVVEDEECEASGLAAGTDYDFRVRAVPSDTDRYETSAWSDTLEERTSGTAPRPPTPPTSGGMGALNVRWESTDTATEVAVTWIWDRIPDATYDIDAAVVTDGYNDSTNPCESADYGEATASSATSYRLTAAAGNVALLCVRTNNPVNSSENLSFAWAAATPVAPALATTPTRARDTDKDDEADMTTALLWSGFAVKGGFNYEYRVVADPQAPEPARQIIIATTSADDVQAACDAGTPLDDGESDVDFTDNNIVMDSGLKTFTGYLLCARYGNTAGKSGWAVPASNAENYTRPARPSSPAVYTSLVNETATTTAVVWRVATRGREGLPRLAARYTVRTITHRDRQDDPDDTGIRTLGVKAPTAASCEDTSLSAPYTGATAVTTNTNDGDGIVISPTAFDRPAAVATGEQNLGNLRAYVCVQATDTATEDGPWVLSSPYTVKQQAASN